MPDLEWWLRTLWTAAAEAVWAGAAWRGSAKWESDPVRRACLALGVLLALPAILHGLPWPGPGIASPASHMLTGLLALSATIAVKPIRSPAHARLAFLPLLALPLFLRPVSEADSLYNLHYLLNWLDHGIRPHEFAFHYPPFFEAGTIPLLAGSRHDALLWVASAKAILLLALLLWMLAGEFGLQGWLRTLAVAQAMLFLHLWTGHSGLATIKNDMLAACGQALLLWAFLRATQKVFTNFEIAAAVLGGLFVSTKFSGPFLLLLLLPLSLWIHWPRWRASWKSLPGPLWFGLLVWLAGPGHTYVANLWRFGNPFYPFTLRLGPLELPGLGDLSGTSIAANWQSPEVWRCFFLPDGGVSPLGLFFPVTFAALVPLSLVALRNKTNAAFPAVYLAGFALYLRSIFSAGGSPGDLQFLRNDLNSMRYLEGFYLAGELWLAARLARWPGVAAALLALSAVSRLGWLAARSGPDGPAHPLTMGLGTAFLAAGWLAWRWLRLPGFVLVVLLGGALIVESHRDSWLPAWQPLYLPVYRAERTQVHVLVQDPYSPQPALHLPAAGWRLRHKVTTGPENEVGDARYVLWLRRNGETTPSLPGFTLRSEVPAGALWDRKRP